MHEIDPNVLLFLISMQCFVATLCAYRVLSARGYNLLCESVVQSGMLLGILTMIFSVHGLILG